MELISPFKYGLVMLMMASFLFSCSRLPVIKPVEPSAAAALIEQCGRPYPSVPYRFVHAIEVTLPGGSSGTLIGVSLVDPKAAAVQSAMMTLEGFVLFDGAYDKNVHVDRAVPPFDKPQFAKNMLGDVRLMYLAPEGKPVNAGTLKGGAVICRYIGNQYPVMDVIVHRDGSWDIDAYSESEEPRRRIRAGSVKNGIPETVELKAYEAWDYTLQMRLISADPVVQETAPVSPGRQPDE
ncbi:MAG: hypothetical protein M0P16_07975 [Syntrophales bacterium]|jgi:hypothetical protein|nr:hypothetical protein [Syntrophales bacterium]MCK9391060.1 hypothetical protein [Syntrophales bacterium]